MARNTHATFGTVWTFKAGRFLISLELERESGFRYDGEDEDGETQGQLDSGELVAFSSTVTVELDGQEIGRDSLFGSVYARDSVADFYSDHRSADPMNRNCSAMRAERGNVSIVHYFPSMVSEAIAAARAAIRAQRQLANDLPFIREGA